MIFTEKHRITWQHDIHSSGGQTICYIEDKEAKTTFFASAFCSENDQYCKETGRKISLTRALKQTNFDKGQRKEVWETYLNR